MAHVINPYNLDDDDDAVFSALLSEGLIWIEDDDEIDEDETQDKGLDDPAHSIHSGGKRQPPTTAKSNYEMYQVLQEAHYFISNRAEKWVNFDRLAQHLHKQFYNLKTKLLAEPNKKYKNLLAFFAAYPASFELLQDDKKQGLYWIRINRPE